MSITKEQHVGKLDVQGGPTPIEISISEYFFIKWIEAIGSGPAATP